MTAKNEDPEINWLVAIMVYQSYALLIAFGHMRDLLGSSSYSPSLRCATAKSPLSLSPNDIISLHTYLTTQFSTCLAGFLFGFSRYHSGKTPKGFAALLKDSETFFTRFNSLHYFVCSLHDERIQTVQRHFTHSLI